MPHYALVMADGDSLGLVELNGGANAWPSGSVIPRDRGADLRVIGCHAVVDPEWFAILVVEPFE